MKKFNTYPRTPKIVQLAATENKILALGDNGKAYKLIDHNWRELPALPTEYIEHQKTFSPDEDS